MEYENEIESTGWQCFWLKVEAEIYLDFARKLCLQFAQNYAFCFSYKSGSRDGAFGLLIYIESVDKLP